MAGDHSAAARAAGQAGIGYIPQGRDVFPRMTVEENLPIGEMINRSERPKL